MQIRILKVHSVSRELINLTDVFVVLLHKHGHNHSSGQQRLDQQFNVLILKFGIPKCSLFLIVCYFFMQKLPFFIPSYHKTFQCSRH